MAAKTTDFPVKQRQLNEDIKNGKYEGQYKIEYEIKGQPLVSIVIPNMDHI